MPYHYHFTYFYLSVPYRCQINGCNNTGTCNTATGECECDGSGDHNYQCTLINTSVSSTKSRDNTRIFFIKESKQETIHQVQILI